MRNQPISQSIFDTQIPKNVMQTIEVETRAKEQSRNNYVTEHYIIFFLPKWVGTTSLSTVAIS